MLAFFQEPLLHVEILETLKRFFMFTHLKNVALGSALVDAFNNEM